MKQLTKFSSFLTAAVFTFASGQIVAQATSLSNLLDLVEQDRVAESEEYQARLSDFESNATRQREILDTTNQRITAEEQTQVELSDQFEANEIIIADKREILRDRRGALNELFGTLQGVAGDFLSNFENSLISAQYTGRSLQLEEIIERAGSTIEQLNVEEMERFWFFMHQELTESGQVVSFNSDVTLPNGYTANRSIVRVGAFQAVSDGEYPQKVLDDVGIERYCCRRMLVGHVDLIDDISPFSIARDQ